MFGFFSPYESLPIAHPLHKNQKPGKSGGLFSQLLWNLHFAKILMSKGVL